ncbi:DUF1835 domain-containing protein [Pontibacter sp. H249]|uniref:DUF1835 domain-containing protein n=1 Tax=Pontibacter sp. H249 TaxID=3133420 RepID=UPI0030BCFBB0
MKKLPSLHILNGDATLPVFEKANFPGQVLVWREVLSEGPAIGIIPEHEFWQHRQKYICETYQESTENYKQKALSALSKLDNAHAFFEVILWFDSDLMCQVNLLYLLQKLSQVKPAVVSVCTPEAGKSIGYLTSEELHRIFENRQMQTQEQLQQAKQLWQLYASPDPLQLQNYLLQHKLLLPDTGDALHLHLRRFPDCTSGLSHPETVLLELIESGADTFELMMQRFWKKEPGYGFGDSQLQHILERLQPDLISKAPNLQLTKLAQQILRGNAAFTPVPKWLGGTQVKPGTKWCYSKKKEQLVIQENLAPNMQ